MNLLIMHTFYHHVLLTLLTVFSSHDMISTYDKLKLNTSAPQVTVLNIPTLNCANHEDQIIIQVNPPGSYDFAWTGPNGFSSNAQNPTVTQGGTYIYSVTNTTSGSNVMDSVTVEANFEFINSGLYHILNCDSTATLCLILEDTIDQMEINWFGPGIDGISDTLCVRVDTLGIYAVEVINLLSSCVISTLIEIDNLECSSNSVHQITRRSILAYPNPFVDFLYIETGAPVEQLKIHNLSGEVVYADNHNIFKSSYDLSSLPNGTYILSIKSNNDWSQSRIIKIK